MLHPDAGTTGDRSSALVHTHGSRLVRLAHLLGAPDPEQTAADALALTLLHRGRGDAHWELLTAAQHVGAHVRPPIHDAPRLQGWLDRAELDSHPVDLTALQQATVARLTVQRARRSTSRRRMAAGALAVVVGLVGVNALTDEEADTTTPNTPLSMGGVDGLRPALGDPADPGPVDVARLLAPPARLPTGLRAAAGVVVADAVLTGPARPVARVHLEGAPTTLLGVACAPRDDPPSLCLLALREDQPLRSLRSAQLSPLVATLPLPLRGRLISSNASLVTRHSSVVDEFDLETVLMEVTSARVDSLYVTFANGQSTYATRYVDPAWDASLFVLIAGDQTPAQLSYLSDGVVVDRRSLYTATP